MSISNMKRSLDNETTKRVHSYGLIVRCKNEYLIIQNRDTEAFIYFFYANISKWTRNHCCKVFRKFSYDEKQRLLYYPFHNIYTDLYIHFNETTHHRQYEMAKRNFQYFKSQKWMTELLLSTPTSDISFLFPKGRIEKDESPVECATREFWEETKLDISKYVAKIDPEQSVTYEHYRPFYRFISVNQLFFLDIPEKLDISYAYFENRIRPLSVSNEIMHATWVDEFQLRQLLSNDIFMAVRHHLLSTDIPSVTMRMRTTRSVPS